MSLFRSHITRVGALLRLTGPFAYANQASMFLEATLPLLLAPPGGSTAGRCLVGSKQAAFGRALTAHLFQVQAIILTLSRAGAATVVVVSLLLAALLLWRQPSARRKMASGGWDWRG
jgi:hypothetical protein